MCWKALSREDRKAWEEKAVTAQAEHRKRYPDWRFRPGANAMARLKFKDGGGGPTRRGHTRVKVPPDRGGGEDDEPGAVLDDLDAEEMSGKAKGKAVTRGRERKTKTKKQIEKEKTASQRHVKIKDFLVEGKTPAELEAAIAEWDRETKGRDDKDKDHEKSGNAEASSSSASPFSAHQPHLSIQEDLVEHIASSLTPDTVSEGAFPPSSSSETYRNRPFDNNPQRSRSRSPDNPPHYHVTSLSKVPLTHMFKRSLSAPAPHHRSSYPSEALTHANNHPLRQVMMPVDTPPTLYEGTSHVPPHAHGHGPGHIRRDTISLPIHSSEYLFAQSHNDLGFRDIERSLSWQEEEDRRRVESAQEHGYWWTGSADEDEDDMYEPRREGSFEMGFNISTEGMGYDETATSSFDQAYLEEVSFMSCQILLCLSLIVTELNFPRVSPLILSITYLVMQVTVLIGPMYRGDMGLSPWSRIRSCTPNGAADLRLLPRLHRHLSQYPSPHHLPSVGSRQISYFPPPTTPEEIMITMRRSPLSRRTPPSLPRPSQRWRGGMVCPSRWRHLDQENAHHHGSLMHAGVFSRWACVVGWGCGTRVSPMNLEQAWLRACKWM